MIWSPEAIAKSKAANKINGSHTGPKCHFWKGGISKDRKAYAKLLLQRQKTKYHSDPKYRLRMVMSSAIYQTVKHRKANRSWLKLVDYTLEELIQHLERQFQPGMTWKNYGKWHIDHIIPIAAWNFIAPKDPEFKKCWALINLQPLWARDNLSKHARLDDSWKRVPKGENDDKHTVDRVYDCPDGNHSDQHIRLAPELHP